MRASRSAQRRPSARSRNNTQSPGSAGVHISGAEGIYDDTEITGIISAYARRALRHPRGRPDEIVITIEALHRKPGKIPLLPITTLECNAPDEAYVLIFKALSDLGISSKAISAALRVLTAETSMRGASLIRIRSGRRAEPDRIRGVRVSGLGIERVSGRRLSQKLSRLNLDTTTVGEALALASKVASCPGIAAEICISDDPDYTTGYIASRESGYLRIPNIKNHGEMYGGRVFFIREDAAIEKLMDYLEKTPVILY